MDEATQGLLERASGGDPVARQRLLETFRDHLRRMIAARLDQRVSSRVDPSDVVQDTLLEASRRLDVYLEERSVPFLVWLRQIAGERVIDTYRRHVGSQRRSVLREHAHVEVVDASSGVLAGWLVDGEPSPSAEMQRLERLEQVQAALERLPARDREILVMRHLERLKIEEIAGLLGITHGAAKARILRALLKMRQLVDDEP